MRYEVFLMKIAFYLVAKHEALWVRVLRAKYKCWDIIPEQLHHGLCSCLWKGLKCAWDDVRQGTCWKIRDGRSVDFWRIRWLAGCDSLITYVDPHWRAMLGHPTVIEMVKNSGDSFTALLPLDVVQRIVALHGSLPNLGPNMCEALKFVRYRATIWASGAGHGV
ncbi:hypothetical protein V6N13_109430 [Hibiscus sabdariffa]